MYTQVYWDAYTSSMVDDASNENKTQKKKKSTTSEVNYFLAKV